MLSGNEYSLICNWGTQAELDMFKRRQAQIRVSFSCGQMGQAHLRTFRWDDESESERETEYYVLVPTSADDARNARFPLASGPVNFVKGEPSRERSSTSSGALYNLLFSDGDHYAVWVDETHPHFGAIVSGLSLIAEFYERRREMVGECSPMGSQRSLL